MKHFRTYVTKRKVINEGKGHKIEGNHNLNKYTSPNYICSIGKKKENV